MLSVELKASKLSPELGSLTINIFDVDAVSLNSLSFGSFVCSCFNEERKINELLVSVNSVPQEPRAMFVIDL